MKCNICGEQNEENSNFCKNCGSNLKEEIEKLNEKKEPKKRLKTKKQKTTKNKKKIKKQRKDKKVKKVYNKNYKKGMTIGQKILMFILMVLVLIIIALGAFVAYKYYENKDMVEVPNVTGLTYEQAKLRLEEEGLIVFKKEEETEILEENNIILQQSKESGKKVKEGSIIKLDVGKYEVELPDFVGANVDSAKTKLEQLGLQYVISEKEDKDYDCGIIISQNIRKGTMVELDDVIKLVVSKNETEEKIIEEEPKEQEEEQIVEDTNELS